MARKPERLIDGLKFGEGPRWRDGRLWYSDFYAHHVRAVDTDGGTLIVGETFANCLTAFDVAEDGGLSNRRLWAEMEGGVPDGICLDAEGAIWVADPRGKRVIRYAEGGRVLDEIGFGDRGAYACMLGGPERRHLFIVTNFDSGPAAEAGTDGAIEVIEVDVPGAGLP